MYQMWPAQFIIKTHPNAKSNPNPNPKPYITFEGALQKKL